MLSSDTIQPNFVAPLGHWDGFAEEYEATGRAIPPKPVSPYLVLVTPDLATEWLDANDENRHLRAPRAEAFARDMTTGAWDPLVGDPVHFNEANGKLGNGQHRLRAVEISGTAQWFYVLFVPKSTLLRVDRGTKRNLADNLMFQGYGSYSPLQASIARRIVIARNGFSPVATGRFTPSDEEIYKVIETENDKVLRAAQVATKIRLSQVATKAGVTAMAYYMCANIDQEAADKFFVTQLAEKIELKKNDPANALLRRLANHKSATGSKMADPELWNYIIIAWNHFRSGNEVERLQPPRNGYGETGYAVPV